MSKRSNWPDVDYGHSNWTLRTPRVSKWGGQGSWEADSSRIDIIKDAALLVALVAVMGFIFYVGCAVGF